MENYTRQRPHQIKLWVSDEELRLIREKKQLANIRNTGAYLRKMAIDGYVINVDITGISETIRLLRYSSNNLNQIARHANETGGVYKNDLEEIQKNYKELWCSLKEILRQVNMITKS